MKNMIKCSLLAVFAIGGAFVGLGSDRAHAGAPGNTSPRSLYIQNCARCHGSDGRANTPMGRKLEAADLTTADVQGKGIAGISRVIKNGRPGMPAFGKRLRPAQISSIASYVRSF